MSIKQRTLVPIFILVFVHPHSIWNFFNESMYDCWIGFAFCAKSLRSLDQTYPSRCLGVGQAKMAVSFVSGSIK